jgi:hypothetical protein
MDRVTLTVEWHATNKRKNSGFDVKRSQTLFARDEAESVAKEIDADAATWNVAIVTREPYPPEPASLGDLPTTPVPRTEKELSNG